MKRRYRSQKRIPGTYRTPIASCVIKDIETAITREMRRYSVSRSFVIATALAHVFKIEEQEEYR